MKRKEDYIDTRKYLDPEKVLALRDAEGRSPAQISVDSNRGDGKTTSFAISSLLNFYNNGYETSYLFRDKKELSVIPYMFEDIFHMYPDLKGDWKKETIVKDGVLRFLLNGRPFIISLSIKDVDTIKKMSGIFHNTTRMIFEEFQKEKGSYLPNEVRDVQSIFTSANRGGGKRDRNMKLIMLGNHITLLNPYYVYRGIHKKWKQSQKYYRGKGWVAQISYNKQAAEEIANSNMNRSFTDEFGRNSYGGMATGDNYLIEADSFIEQPLGRNRYICTIIHNNMEFCVREYYQSGCVFIGHKVDPYCDVRITFNPSDHRNNTMMLNHYSFFFKFLKKSFEAGYLFFEDDRSKIAVFDILGLTLF